MNLELEITLRCNAKCPACSRHCNIVDYGDTDMTLEQIRNFIDAVSRRKRPMGMISVMGGEPLLHPEFENILKLLCDELLCKKKVRKLVVATNGVIKPSKFALGLPVNWITSPPNGKRHRCQLVAPKDTGQKLKKSCKVPFTCGLALNVFGYSPCGAGAAIARLFGLPDYIQFEMPDSVADFGDLLSLCELCQAGAVEPLTIAKHGTEPSSSFAKALSNFKKD